MKKLVVFSIVVAALAFVVLRSDGVSVMIKNVGPDPMREVVVHVTGASYHVGDLRPGESASVKVCPKGETHVEVAQSKGERLVINSYFEPGYSGEISAEISTAKVVAVRSSVAP